MNPKSYKIFKEGIADEVGVHENVVDDLVTFYYGKVRKNLSDLTHPNINITGLGTFTIRKVRLEKNIKKNKSYLGNITKNTINGYEKHLTIQDKIDKMENMLDMCNKLLEEKKKFKANKKWINI
mgnify:CR=1 FL=1